MYDKRSLINQMIGTFNLNIYNKRMSLEVNINKLFNIKNLNLYNKKVYIKTIFNDKIKLGLKYYGKFEGNIPRKEIS